MDKALLDMAIAFHGHKCPAMPMGIRAGLLALNTLGVARARNKELFCLCETGSAHAAACFVDGVQVATGCTFGKSNIEKQEFSKNAITLIDISTKRAVRVAVKPELMEQALASEFVSLRKEGVEPQDIDPAVVDPLVDLVGSLSDEKMFIVGPVESVDWEPRKGTFDWRNCAGCGEVTFAHGLREIDGEYFCIPCAERTLTGRNTAEQ